MYSCKPISNVSIIIFSGFMLVADMVFMQQSTGQILCAMYKICLKPGWAVTAKAALNLCKMVEKQ
ncbi:hypothetical protein L208DRAFT_1546804, partial [Tricholoma matsutake]